MPAQTSSQIPMLFLQILGGPGADLVLDHARPEQVG